MIWPNRIIQIIERYFIEQVKNGGQLSSPEKEDMVKLLISEYHKLSIQEQIDVLIPAKGCFLRDDSIGKDIHPRGTVEYFFRYLWPQNSFASKSRIMDLEVGKKYDRIGAPSGKYLSPIKPNGEPETFLARALPYYVPETDIRKSPAYHAYKIEKRYESSILEPVREGITAPAFWHSPSDGGAVQIELPKSLNGMGGVFVEQI